VHQKTTALLMDQGHLHSLNSSLNERKLSVLASLLSQDPSHPSISENSQAQGQDRAKDECSLFSNNYHHHQQQNETGGNYDYLALAQIIQHNQHQQPQQQQQQQQLKDRSDQQWLQNQQKEEQQQQQFLRTKISAASASTCFSPATSTSPLLRGVAVSASVVNSLPHGRDEGSTTTTSGEAIVATADVSAP